MDTFRDVREMSADRHVGRDDGSVGCERHDRLPQHGSGRRRRLRRRRLWRGRRRFLRVLGRFVDDRRGGLRRPRARWWTFSDGHWVSLRRCVRRSTRRRRGRTARRGDRRRRLRCARRVDCCGGWWWWRCQEPGRRPRRACARRGRFSVGRLDRHPIGHATVRHEHDDPERQCSGSCGDEESTPKISWLRHRRCSRSQLDTGQGAISQPLRRRDEYRGGAEQRDGIHLTAALVVTQRARLNVAGDALAHQNGEVGRPTRRVLRPGPRRPPRPSSRGVRQPMRRGSVRRCREGAEPSSWRQAD